MVAAPDQSCEVGGSVAGWDVYVWSCTGGERVVVAQYSGEMSCSSPIHETAPCGGTTSFEREHPLTPAVCKAARSGRDWRVR